MKKTILSIAALLVATVASAQFYISASGGYSFGAGKKNLGEEVTTTGKKDLSGTYGEGIEAQLRGGYLFNEKMGVELGLGYIYGADQQVRKVSGIPTAPEIDVKARGRAYGASLSFLYNITENIYGRAGFLTKIGGKTEAVGKVNANLPKGSIPTIPIDSKLEVDFTTDFEGKFPAGYILAVGYKYPLGDGLAVFGELEYKGVNVTRDKSSVGDFSAKLTNALGTTNLTRDQLVASLKTANPIVQKQFEELLPLVQDKTEWGKNGLPAPDAPYSAFGINIGITYSFGGGSTKAKAPKKVEEKVEDIQERAEEIKEEIEEKVEE